MDEAAKEKCFVMMPISDQGDYPEGHFTKVYEQIFKPAIEAAGYEPYRVDENNICDSIINKIFEAIQECPMALCDLSNRNPNVLYELGIRQTYDKPVVLVQDDQTEKIFDVSGINTIQYKTTRLYENVLEARERIEAAIISTREGKENSIMNLMQLKAADFSPKDSISQQDRIEIKFNSILTEIRGLKKDSQSYTDSHNRDDSMKGLSERLEDRYRNVNTIFSECRMEIALKDEVSNADIKATIDLSREMFQKEIWYKRRGSVLEVIYCSVDTNERDKITEFIRNNIGTLTEK